MARHWRVRYSGAKYHLTARGKGRQDIFELDEDRERFLEQLKDAMEADEIVLHAYVLMSTHYHLLVETPLGNVQKFMQRLNTAYAMYYRFKRDKVGHCFQGRYGAKLVKDDEYILRLTRYIHLNPVKIARYRNSGQAERKAALNSYRWSSYRGYAGVGPKEELVNYRCLKLLGRFTDKRSRAAYREYIEGLLGGEDEELKEAQGISAYAIGDREFIEETEEEIKEARMSKVVTGDIVWPEKRKKGLDEVVGAALKVVGLKTEDLTANGRRLGEKKGVVVELLCRHASASQRAVAKKLGYRSETSVGKQRQLMRKRLREKPGFAKGFEKQSSRLEKLLFS